VSDTSKSIPETIQELREMVVTYAKQETIDPLKGLGRFIGYGVGGSFMLGIGLVLLTLAGLRALQTQTGTTFRGHLSWAPYVIMLAGVGLATILALTRISKKRTR
jgi:hypothetical protein